LMGDESTAKPREGWEILSSRYVVKDRWLSLRADDCRTPDGSRVAPYYVLEYPPWVNVIALTPAMEVVLIRQYRHGVRQTILEVPGGAFDPQDASVAETARRELLEETGYGVETVMETGSLCASPHNHTNMIHCFLAFDARRIAEPRLEHSEQIEVVLRPWHEFVECAYRGELRHPHHVASLFFALQRLGRA
jgi:ADP-ribose pyrophosphatase